MNLSTRLLAFQILFLCAAVVGACATAGDADDPVDAADLRIDAPGPAIDAAISQIDADVTPGPDAATPAIDAAVPPPDAACVLGWVDLLQNGGFEANYDSWLQATDAGDVIRMSSVPWAPQAGAYWSLFLGYNYGEQSLSQTVSVPASATALRLRGYRCWVTEETPLGLAYDYLNVELHASGGGLLETVESNDNTDAGVSCNWEAFEFNAGAAYAGQDIVLKLDATSDVSSITSFGIDSLVLEAMACL